MKYIKLILLLPLLFLFSCESMEDTYSDYSGAKIRYVGKIKYATIENGWKKFRFNWDLYKDKNVKKIKLKWITDKQSDSVILDKSVAQYTTEPIFENKSYEFKIYCLDNNGNQSLPYTLYGKPYTYENSLVKTFYPAIKKAYFCKDNLVLIFTKFKNNISQCSISYTQNNEAKEMELTKEIIDQKYLIIENIDVDKDVILNYKGALSDCFEEIVFRPKKIVKESLFLDSDIVLALKFQYGVTEITEEFVNNLEVINIDRDMISLKDILNFPNLKKVILGGNRHRKSPHFEDEASTVQEVDESVFALTTANQINGVEVNVYNKEYLNISSKLSFANNLGNPILPALDYLDYANWTVTVNTKEDNDETHPEYILDDDIETVWIPAQFQFTARNHELIIDMKEFQKLKGFVFAQPCNNAYNAAFKQNNIGVQTSMDGVHFTDALFQSDIPIGDALGEKTLYRFANPINARFVKISITDKVGNRFYTYIADFLLF